MNLMGYTAKAIQGFGWHTIFKITTTGLSALKVIIVARILSPADFGLFSLATIALGLTEAFTETGINITLLQSKRSISYYIDTAWVIAIIRGLVIALIMGLASLIMRQYYSEPTLLPLITLAAFVPLIKGFINPNIVSLQKDLSFFWDSVYRIALSLIESVSAVVLVYFFHSVFGLIFAMIISATFEVIVSFLFFRLRPRFNYKSTRAKEVFDQMKWLNISSVLGYLHENLDNILIGKLAGTTNLGYYHNAYALSHKPNYELAQSVHHSTLPVYTKINQNRKRFAKAFLRSSLSSLGLFVVASLPFLVFPQLITWLLGPQWQPAVSLIRPLIMAGLLQSFAMLTYTFLIAQAKYKAMNWHLFSTTVLMAIFIVVLTPHYGLLGTVWGVLLSRVITLLILGKPVLDFLTES